MTGDSSSNVIAIAGVGLLGGSIAAAVRERQLARHIVGIGRNAERLAEAQRRGLIDSYVTDLSRADPIWDLAIVGTPVDRIVADVKQLAAISRPGTLITDVGSVKGPIVAALRSLATSAVKFIGSHPLAGSEKQGFEAAHANLFKQRVVVVTPDGASDPTQVEEICQFWRSLEARVITMNAEAHDRALATTSHLPHIAASALAIQLQEDQHDLAATGFRDTTRIASGDPDLWVAILLGNVDAVRASLAQQSQTLAEFDAALRDRNAEQLRALLAKGKANRDGWQSAAAPGVGT